MKRNKTLILALLFVGSLVAVGTVVYLLMRPQSMPQPLHQPGSVISVEGNSGCLPYKGNGPHTLECTVGLRTNNGYYALRNLQPEYYATDQILLVTGKFETAISDDPYDTVGTINVQSVRAR